MPHTTLPSHCFGRQELHAIVSRANQLSRDTAHRRSVLAGVPRPGQAAADGELSAALTTLALAAATLDAVLADLSADEATRRRYAAVFADPDGWEPHWVEAVEVVHAAAGDHVIKLSQQVFRTPAGCHVPTSRHRVTLDGAEYPTTDPRELRPVVAAYLGRTPGIPAGLHTDLMAFVGVE